jgi:cholesterol transport system auxiliary component
MNLAPRRRSVAASLGMLPLLAACGGLLPKPPERQLYRLTATPVFRAGLPRVPAQLLVATPTSLAAFDTARIALSRSAITLEYFADAEWADRAPFVVQAALIDAFEKSRVFSGISSESSGLQADFVLATEVRDFAAVYDSPNGPPRVRVQLNAELIRMPGRKILAETVVTGEAAAAGNDLPVIVQSFGSALGVAASDLVNWAAGVALSAGRGSVKSRADTFRSPSSTRQRL